jgi:hypothetical protein
MLIWDVRVITTERHSQEVAARSVHCRGGRCTGQHRLRFVVNVGGLQTV